MNIWGKVFAFLVILLGGAVFFLTTQMLDFRQSWVKQVDAGQKRLDEEKSQTILKRKESDALHAEYDRLMLGWGSYFGPVNVTGDAAQGTLTLPFGTESFGEKKDKDGNVVRPVLFAFQPDPTGKFEYVGEFRVERMVQGNSTFRANWRLRPDDSQMWKLGPGWRFRTRIPGSDKLKFDDFALQFSFADEVFNAKTAQLNRLTTEFAAKIAKVKKNRESEIQGFENADEDRGKLNDEDVDGVLSELIKEEEARNAALAAGDQLRHKLHGVVQQFEKLHSANKVAEKAMPRTAPPEPAGDSVSKR